MQQRPNYRTQPTYFQQYQEFAVLCDIPTRLIDGPPNLDMAQSGWRLIDEEFMETMVAWNRYVENPSKENLVEIADGCADLIYVVCDFAWKLGIPLDECWNAVHENNMRKIWPDGTVKKDANRKVMKPPGFEKVKLWDVLHKVSNEQAREQKLFGAENWKPDPQPDQVPDRVAVAAQSLTYKQDAQ